MIQNWRYRFNDIFKAVRTEGTFVQNSFLMFSSSGASILIQFGFAFILSRIYSENDYGIFQIFNSYVVILSSIVTLNFNQAFVLPKTERAFIALFHVTVRLAITMCAVITLISLVAGKHIMQLLNQEELGSWIYMLGPTCLLLAFDRIVIDTGVRQTAFKKMLIWNSASTIVSKVFNVIYGSIHATPGGLILTNILNYLLQMVFYAKWVTNDFWNILTTKVSKKERKEIIQEYKSFPMYVLPGNLVNTISNFLPPIILASLGFGFDNIGFYGYSLLLLDLPIRMLGSGIGAVFLPKANEILTNRPAELTALVWKLLRTLLIITSLFITVISVFGEPLYSLFFSERWAPAGKLAEIFSIYYFFYMVSSPLSVLFNVMRREKIFLFFQVILFVVRLLVLIGGSFYTNDFFTLMLAYAIANGIMHFGLCIIIYRLVSLRLPVAILYTLLSCVAVFTAWYGIKGLLFG